jgi:hypothetical protein
MAATIAQADVVGGANVRVTFNGWLTPRALPRTGLAPVKLHLKGRLWTSDGRSPPPLRRVVFAINRHGKVAMRGLPVCRKSAILSTSSAQALASCRKALVGSGRFNAHIEIPTQAPFPARGRMLAFHSKRHGRHVILAHIFGTDPVPTVRVLTLTFQRPKRRGRFGATMSLRLPELGEDWGHVSGFELALHRRYTYRNQRRSVVSASCPAPRGFTLAVFTAAKGTYYLADGRVITRVITGTCKVRR